MVKILAHIAGTSGSGKTFLGEKIKNKLKLKVKDLDDFQNKEEYINYINNLKDNVNLILVGYNDFNGEIINIDSKYKFYIKEKDDIIIKRKLLRDINYFYKNKNIIINKIIDEKKTIVLDYQSMKNYIEKDNILYLKKLKYKHYNQEKIFNIIKKFV